MFIKLNKKRGQSTLEYAVIISVVVAALIAMQTYFKRGVQGKLKQASDDIGEAYSPGHSSSDYTITSRMSSTESTRGGESPKSDSTTWQRQDRTGGERVEDFNHEYWPEATKPAPK